MLNADDIELLALRANAMREMLLCCDSYASILYLMLANLSVCNSFQRVTIESYSKAYQYSLCAVKLSKLYSSGLILVLLFHIIWMIDMIL